MLEEFKKHAFIVFTGVDNTTLDLGRILWALGAIVFFVLSVHAVWHGWVFDPIAWGTGFGAVLAGGGASLMFKRQTEPPSR